MSLAEVTMGGAVVVRGSSFKDRVYWTMDKDMGEDCLWERGGGQDRGE